MEPLEVQELLDTFSYHVDDPYVVKAPKRCLLVKKVHCLEAAIVAAYLLPQYKPLLLHLTTYNYSDAINGFIAHAIFVYEDNGGFFSIGRSKFEALQGRLMPQRTVEDLARDYGWSMMNVGRLFKEAGTVNLDEMDLRFDWRQQICDITMIEEKIISYRKKLNLSF
ncbi:MAG: hypothetical protein ABIJ34_08415 [archaeon]